MSTTAYNAPDFGIQLHKATVSNVSNLHDQPKRHIDSCGFWQNLYEGSLKENKRLHSKVLLEEERRRLFERSVNPHDDGNVARKRPLGMEEVEEWIENDDGIDPIDLIGDDYLRLSSNSKLRSRFKYQSLTDSAAIRIARHRRDLERITKDSGVPEHIDTLSSSACKLLSLIDVAMSECLMPIWQLKCINHSQIILLLRQMMCQINLAYVASFEALNELVQTIPGRKKRIDVTNRLVTFFKTALDHLHSISTLQADLERDQKGRFRTKRVKAEPGEYAVNKYLTIALVQICQLDWKTGIPSHSEILEGIICSVLTHTGHLLSHVVFREHVAESAKHGNISMDRPLSPTVGTKYEFRYIIPILHAALGGNLRKELVAKVLTQSRGSAVDTHGDMMSKAKKLMQEQLVKSAVGADMEGLKLPAPPEDPESYSPGVTVEQYEAEWFLQSIWALVGWELTVTAES